VDTVTTLVGAEGKIEENIDIGQLSEASKGGKLVQPLSSKIKSVPVNSELHK